MDSEKTGNRPTGFDSGAVTWVLPGEPLTKRDLVDMSRPGPEFSSRVMV